jgi:VWFA-related protein
MGKSLGFTVLWLLAQAALGQNVPTQSAPPQTLHSNSTLVVVPTLVERASGELIPNLQANDFVLTDNGIPQKVSLEQVERQPVAVVVLLQIGGAAQRQIPNYKGLPAMLDHATAGSPRQLAMVTFDSEPEEASDFTASVDDLKEDLTHPRWGNSHAAILDAVNYGIDLLDKQPAGTRKVLLLVSQTYDDGSNAKAEDILHRLGETNTLICSLTFSPEKQWLKDQLTGAQERTENPPYEFSPGIMLDHTINLDGPFRILMRSMKQDTAEEIAKLSGGESLPFGNQADADRQLSLLANHLPNRYTLTFRPSSNQPGLHTIRVQVLHQPQPVTVKARESYWATGPN